MALENLEIDIALTPKQQEFRGAIDRYRELLFGGARGGGKSRGLRSIHIIRRVQMPRSKGVIWRRTYPELEKNHIRPLFAELPQLRAYYNESKRLLTLPNGSSQEFCYAESRRDLSKAQGTETDDLGLEEAGDWLEDEFEILLATNRSSQPGIEPRAQLTANPGGRGHAWLKRRYVQSKDPTRGYIRSLIDDNPALMDNDPNYLKVLEGIKSPTLRKAWRYGDWDISAGQFFTEFSRDIHVVKPFEIPAHWNRFVAHDHGFNHPGVWLWFAVSEDGAVYVYRELVKAGMTLDFQASEFKKWPEHSEIKSVRAGHDCFQKGHSAAFGKSRDRGPTIAEYYAQEHGIFLARANIDRKAGANQIRMYLEHGEKPPRLFFFDTCEITIDCLGRMVHNPDDVEDVLKVDAVEGDPWTGDDPYDCLRHGIMSRPALTKPLPKKNRDGWAEDTRPKRASGWTT